MAVSIPTTVSAGTFEKAEGVIDQPTVLPPDRLQHLKGVLPSVGNVQNSLLVLTVAFGVLSVIPPLRFVGALGVRSISLLSTLTSCVEQKRNSNWVDVAIRSAKIGVVTLGLVAVATATPLFAVASLAADLALQALDAGRTVEHKEYTKACVHLWIAIIDALAIAAIVTGSWPLMVAAASVSILAMLVMGIKIACDGKKGCAIGSICYIALAALGIASACSVAELKVNQSRSERSRIHYSYTNSSDHPVQVTPRDYYSQGTTTLEPGESYDKTCYYSGGTPTLSVQHLVPTPGVSGAIVVVNYPAVGAWTSNEYVHEALQSELFSTITLPGTGVKTKYT